MSIKTTIGWVAAGLIVAARTAAAQDQPPPSTPLVTREYDVRSLRHRLPDDAPPPLGFVRNPALAGEDARLLQEAWTRELNPPDTDVTPVIESVQTMLQENIARGTWDGEHTIGSARGILHIRHTPEVHATIARVIEALWPRLEQPVTLELRELRAPLDVAEAVLDGGPVLDAPRAALLAGEGVTRVRSARLVGLSGQLLHRGSTRDSCYARGCEVAPALGTPTVGALPTALQPTTGWLRTGELDVWRASLDDAGRGLLVEYQRDIVAAATPHATCFVGRPRAERAPPRSIELPRLEERCTATALWMPNGGQVIVEAWRDGDAMHLVVLGHTASARVPPVRIPIPSEPPHAVALFAAGLLARRPVELEPPPAFEQDRVPPAFDPAAGPQLVPRIGVVAGIARSTIAPASWEDTQRCAFGVLRDVMVVDNAPAVVDEVEAMLHRLERARSLSILVRSQLLESSGEPAARAMVDLVGDLGPAQRAALRAQIAAGGVVVRADRTLTAMSGHGAWQLVGERRAFVSGYAAGVDSQIPIVARVRSGLGLLVRPTPTPTEDGAAVEMELRDDTLAMAEERELEDGARLQRPELRMLHRQLRLALPNGGGGALVDLGEGRFLLVEAHVSHAP